MATTIKPRFAAQLQNMPLTVTGSLYGYSIAYVCDRLHLNVHDDTATDFVTLLFADPQEAYRIMREAQGATAALLAGVFGRAVS